MLEKAKNRKIFYFLAIIILCCLFFISSVNATNITLADTCVASKFKVPPYQSWSYYHDGSGTFYADNIIQAHVMNADKSNTYYEIARGGIKVTTGSETISSARLKLIPNLITTTAGTFTVYIVNNTVANTNSKTFFEGADESIVYGSRAISEATLHQPFYIELSGLSPSTTYYFTVMISSDYSNTPPTWSEWTTQEVKFYGHNAGDNSSILMINEPNPEAECDIDVSPTSGASPLAVSFTDDSEGFTEGVDLAYLDYGDGNSYSGTYPGNGATRNYIYLDVGTYNYSYRLTNDGTNYYSNGTVTVTGDSKVNFQVIVRGLNGAYIGNATVNIWYDSGTMIDSDITDDFYGSADFYVNPSRYVNGNVTKDGYYTSNFTYYVCPTGYCSNEVWITLYTTNETPGSGDEFGNYLVTFKNIVTGENVGYSNIEVYSDSGYTTLYYDEYSNPGGVWTGLVPMNIDLYYKYPETTGYYSQSWSYNLTSSPAYKIVNLIPKSGATSTTTPTPTTTTTTITPTVTYTYNDSNLSTLNVKERFTNLLVLAGFQNAESADLIFAMIIVLGCTALIGWITLSGTGAGMGAIIGFVFSLGLGLIPLWLLIAAIFLGCLYVALKLFGGSGE